MKNITVNVLAGVISVSSAFLKKASVVGTPEYNQLMTVRAENPSFRMEIRQFKTNRKQDRYTMKLYDILYSIE